MWMDSSNKVSQEEVIAPLSHDTTGAFSRSGKPVTKEKFDPEWLDTLLIGLYIFFICSVDLILFAGSGNLNVFEGSIFPIGEVSVIMFGIIIFALVITLPFHLCRVQRIAKHIAAAVVTFLVVYVVFRQFFLYSQQYAVGTYMVPLSIFVAVFLAGVTFALFEQDKPLYRILFVVATGVLFLHVYATYHGNSKNPEFVEIHNKQKDMLGDEKRLVYLMMPNLSSYAYFSAINSPKALEVRDIIQGFYQKHNFKIFSKAYTPEFNYVDTMVRTFNPSSDKGSKQHLMSSQLLEGYWRFHNPKNEYIHLQNNELYDFLKKNKYQISAYKSRDVNMCRKNHKYNVSRCVEKVNYPINLRSSGLSLGERTKVLAMEWLTSMHLFGDVANVYKFMNKFISLNYTPLTHIDFDDLYVADSFETLDVVLGDMRKDTGKQAYVVFMDLPSNMYIYDEFCRIRKPEKWQSMVNPAWVRNDQREAKQEAYMQQTLCLYGKLEQFMEGLENNGLLNDTAIVIQGLSGVHDFKNDSSHDNPIDTFVGDKSVVMAIYDSRLDNKQKDDRLCSTSQILAEYLRPDNKCREHLDGYHGNIADGIRKRLTSLNQEITAVTATKFEKWYRYWQNGVGTMAASDQDEDFGLGDLSSDAEENNPRSSARYKMKKGTIRKLPSK